MIPITLHISDKATLDQASDVLRDGEFQDANVVFDADQRTVTITIWRIDEGLAYSTARSHPHRAGQVPMRRCQLMVNGVECISRLEHCPGPGPHPLGGIRWNGQSVLLDTYDGLTIGVDVDVLDGTLVVTTDVVWVQPMP